jgi:WD40 repeat protein
MSRHFFHPTQKMDYRGGRDDRQYYNNHSSYPLPPQAPQAPPPPRLPGIGVDVNLLGQGSVHSRQVNMIAWNMNGKRLATASDDRSARVYEIDDGGNVSSLSKLEGVCVCCVI